MMDRLPLILCLVASGCSAAQEVHESTSQDAGAGASVVDAVLSTDVDFATFAPTGVTGTAFPDTTRQLYLCLRVRTTAARSVVVSWYRVDDDEPFSSSRVTVTGDRWVAAGYEAFSRFEPGSYVVRVEDHGEELAAVSFEIESMAPPAATGGAPQRLSVRGLRCVRELGDDGRLRGPQTTLFPSGSREVHCGFTVAGAAAGTTIEVRWIRGSARVRTSPLGQVEGTREMQASLRAEGDALEAGLYRVEIVANGAVEQSAAFTVEEPYTAEGMRPLVTELALATSVEAGTGRPTSPPVTRVTGTEPALYLSLVFARMPPEQVLEVRWYNTSDPGAEPFALSRFQVAGRGSLAAELSIEEPLEPGSYHVDAVLRGQVLGSLPFTVERDVAPEGDGEE